MNFVTSRFLIITPAPSEIADWKMRNFSAHCCCFFLSDKFRNEPFRLCAFSLLQFFLQTAPVPTSQTLCGLDESFVQKVLSWACLDPKGKGSEPFPSHQVFLKAGRDTPPAVVNQGFGWRISRRDFLVTSFQLAFFCPPPLRSPFVTYLLSSCNRRESSQ